MATFSQIDFSGGMNLIASDTNLGDTEYRELFNGRPRFGSIEPIKDCELINAPAGKKQGLYAIGAILILFCAGQAYYQILGQDVWTKIPNLQLDPEVEYIYTCAVPSSTLNNVRKLNASSDSAGPISIVANLSVAGTPSGIISQDGINQPWVIFYDAELNAANARLCKTYDQWSNDGVGADSREYVPIGSLMFFRSPVLYILAPDGYTHYRSVSGRPMDFMINIDTNGNKLATEDLGGARSTSFSVGFDQVNAYAPLTDTSFLIATRRNIYACTPDLTNTIFAEPTFATPVILSGVGIVNQFSFCSTRADIAYIDFDGVKSFNGTQQFKFYGRNDPFSLGISSYLVDGVTGNPIRQPLTACCTDFNNYSIFSLKTLAGNLLAVYDNYLQKWVAFDSIAASSVKMFAQTNTDDQTLLFAITNEDKVYQLYSADIRATCIFKSGAKVNRAYSGDAITAQAMGTKQHQLLSVYPFLDKGVEASSILCQFYVDGRRQPQFKSLPITSALAGLLPPILPPVTPANVKQTEQKLFQLDQSESGYKIVVILSWSGTTKLTQLDIVTTAQTQHVPKEQQTSTISS